MNFIRSSFVAFCVVIVPTLSWAQTNQVLPRGHRAAVTSAQHSQPQPINQPVESNPGPSGFPDLSVNPASEANQDNGGTGKVTGPAVTVASSLAIVLGLFAGLIWLTRKYGAKSLGQGALPKDVLQSLGSVPIDSRCRITMLRCGSRILVVSQTATGMQPLAEITDPEEVRALTASCLGDSKKMFSTTLESIGREHVRPGFVEPGSAEQPTQRKETPRDRGRLFATA